MKHKGTVLIISGAALLVLALGLFVYNIASDIIAERRASDALSALKDRTGTVERVDAAGEKIIPDYILNPEMDMPVITRDGIDYIGTISLPTINKQLPVASVLTMPILKQTPCRYNGSAYLNNMVIAAHNYRSYFRDLQELAAGDPVVFTDVEGNTFRYRVAETQVLSPTAIDEMIEYTEGLTLFTCTVSGRARVTVRCKAE